MPRWQFCKINQPPVMNAAWFLSRATFSWPSPIETCETVCVNASRDTFNFPNVLSPRNFMPWRLFRACSMQKTLFIYSLFSSISIPPALSATLSVGNFFFFLALVQWQGYCICFTCIVFCLTATCQCWRVASSSIMLVGSVPAWNLVNQNTWQEHRRHVLSLLSGLCGKHMHHASTFQLFTSKQASLSRFSDLTI